MATLRLPATLAPYCAGLRKVEVTGSTVGEALHSLETGSLLRAHVLTEAGVVREHLHLYLGEEDVRDALDTPLRASDELWLLQAMSGGARS